MKRVLRHEETLSELRGMVLNVLYNIGLRHVIYDDGSVCTYFSPPSETLVGQNRVVFRSIDIYILEK